MGVQQDKYVIYGDKGLYTAQAKKGYWVLVHASPRMEAVPYATRKRARNAIKRSCDFYQKIMDANPPKCRTYMACDGTSMERLTFGEKYNQARVNYEEVLVLSILRIDNVRLGA